MKRYSKHQIYLIAFFLASFCFIGCGKKQPVYFSISETEESQEEQTSEEKEDTTNEQNLFYVYVCGAVTAPGVYALPEGSRVYEAVSKAGGLTENAWVEGVNQAALLTDGQMLDIPDLEDAASSTATPAADAGTLTVPQSDTGLVNINTATVEELMELTGIGQTKAESIASYRQEHGSFDAVEDIMNVNGIKEGVYEKIKDAITVN